MAAIHPTAIVEDGARLGADVSAGAYCIVGRDVTLGDGVVLHPHAIVAGRTEIGPGTVVHSHAVVGGAAQVRGAGADTGRASIGANNIIREFVTINGGSPKGGGITRIADDCYFMAYSHVAHDCTVGAGVTLANGVQVGGHVEIGDGAILSGGAAVHQFCRVGAYSFLGGLSGISNDLIPYGMAYGRIAELAGLNLVGLRRRGMSREAIHALRAAYREMFESNEDVLAGRARRALERWPDHPQVRQIAEFVLADAKRPVAVPRGGTEALV